MSDSDIAIIGLAGCFPGAPSLEDFWRNLEQGVESVSLHSRSAAGVPPEWTEREDYVPARAILAGIDLFDASFFGYSPAEAALIDPQQRLFLEKSWEALESAGYDPATYPGSIGVYAGASTNTYLVSQFSPQELPAILSDLQAIVANDKDFLATRVSYKLNLRGPSINVQTACSTSLVAVHLACQTLLLGECDMALAGGVSIRTPQQVGYLHQPGSIYAPDGRCRPFDSAARGTTPGNGLGVVVLKRRDDAERSGDFVQALIRGSAINNDGAAKVGFTAPSLEGQAAAITEAMAIAGVAPGDVAYVEAHGTGTALGDPVEVAALAEAFRSVGGGQRCAIGSVKANIGHLDAAAGIAGLIKAVLSLQHQRIPGTPHFRHANPNIDFDQTPFFVNSAVLAWPRGEGPRRAGVSSFGIGGTNAHVLLEEAPAPAPRAESSGPHLLPVSAQSERQLDQALAALRSHLEGHPGLHLADVAYTLQVGRRAFAHRAAVLAHGLEEASAGLREGGSRPLSRAVCDSARRCIAFVIAAPLPATGEAGFAEALDLASRWVEIGVEPDLLVAPTADGALAAEVQALLSRSIPIVPTAPDSADTICLPLAAGSQDDLWWSRARLWLAGVDIDWSRCHAGGRRVPLPTYPFDRRPCWVGPPESTESAPSEARRHQRPRAAGHRPAATPAERGIVEIFESTLGATGVGVHDNFFDLGGHSLLVVQVLSRIRERFGVSLEPDEVFEAADIAELAANVERAMIAEISALSEEEAQARLKREGP